MKMPDSTAPAKPATLFSVPKPSFQDVVIVVLLVAVLYLVYKIEFTGVAPTPFAATVDAKRIAKLEGDNLLEARAQSLEAFANKLNTGTFDDAATASKETYDTVSKQLYTQTVYPLLLPILPAPGNDATAAQKPMIQAAFVAEAKYLRGLK